MIGGRVQWRRVTDSASRPLARERARPQAWPPATTAKDCFEFDKMCESDVDEVHHVED